MILLWALANPSCVSNLRSLDSAIAEILKGKPLIAGTSPISQKPHPLYLLVGFDDVPWQPQLYAKFEVAGFIYCWNIRDFFKRQIRFLSHPLGDLEVTYGLHRWKARSRLPIRDNWTFFTISYGWHVISRYWSKSALFRGSGSRWAQILGGRGRHPPTIVGIRKLECFC